MENNEKIALKVLSLFPSIKEILETSKEVDIEEKNGIGNIVTSVDKKLESYIKNS